MPFLLYVIMEEKQETKGTVPAELTGKECRDYLKAFCNSLNFEDWQNTSVNLNPCYKLTQEQYERLLIGVVLGPEDDMEFTRQVRLIANKLDLSFSLYEKQNPLQAYNDFVQVFNDLIKYVGDKLNKIYCELYQDDLTDEEYNIMTKHNALLIKLNKFNKMLTTNENKRPTD